MFHAASSLCLFRDACVIYLLLSPIMLYVPEGFQFPRFSCLGELVCNQLLETVKYVGSSFALCQEFPSALSLASCRQYWLLINPCPTVAFFITRYHTSPTLYRDPTIVIYCQECQARHCLSVNLILTTRVSHEARALFNSEAINKMLPPGADLSKIGGFNKPA